MSSLGAVLFLLAAAAAAQPLPPARDPGRIDGWNYTQDFFGLSWTLPEDASVKGAAYTKKLAVEGVKDITDDSLREAAAHGLAHTNTLLTLTLDPTERKARDGVTIVLMAERLPEAAGIETGADFLKIMVETMRATGLPVRPVPAPKPETIGGRTFDAGAFDMGEPEQPSSVMRNTIYAAARGPHILAFSLVHDNEAGLRRGREILGQVRLSSAAWPATPAPAPRPKKLARSKKHEETVKLAFEYHKGAGRKQDLAKAAALYRKAADGGDAEAQARLGHLHLEGTGVAKDEAEAARLVGLAANAGLAWAQASYAQLLLEGTGLKADPAGAVRWLRASARQGNASAMYRLGEAYRDGTGVEASDFESLGWMSQAAARGSVPALLSMGNMFMVGAGSAPKSSALAYRHFKYAADLGDADGQYRAGLLAQEGDGTPKDPAAARVLIEAAAKQGHSDAALWLEKAGDKP